MKVEIINKSNLRESLPIEILIIDTKEKPKVFVENIGTVEVYKRSEKYFAKFWVMEEGQYKILVRNDKKKWEEHIHVEKQEYLNFKQEFGFFSLVFIIVAIGVILWIKKLKPIKN